MKREDEDELMQALAARKSEWESPWPRDVIESFGLVPKAAWRTLEKWSNKGWYEWGVVIDLGWLTEAGKDEARRRGFEVQT